MEATIINAFAIIIGGIVGVIFKKFIKKDICNSILKAVGIVVLIIGIVGVITHMITIDNGVLKSNYELILLISIALGTLIGEVIHIDSQLNRFGIYIETKINKSAFSEGFINASLIFCVGAMAIIGSANAALGNNSILYLKSLIDGITAIVLASTLGFGVIFSGITVLLYQGIFTLLTMAFGSFMSNEFIQVFSIVGYVLVTCIGINFISNDKIKIANMLPSLLIVIIVYLFK